MDWLWGNLRDAYPEAWEDRYVYVLECEGHFKVGITYAIEKRVADIQKSCPFPIKLRHKRRVERGVALGVERAIHEALHSYRMHGEWFAADYAIVRAAFMRGVTAIYSRLFRRMVATQKEQEESREVEWNVTSPAFSPVPQSA